MNRKPVLRIAALLLALLLTLGTVCAAESLIFMTGSMQPGQTISKDSKWINSGIDGIIVEDTPYSLKDDFHTAVNRDFFLSDETDGLLESTSNVLLEKMTTIIRDEAVFDEANCEGVGLSMEAVNHNRELVQDMLELASDTDARNELGVEPARAFIERIEGISSLEELSAYLFDLDGMNLAGVSFFKMEAAPDKQLDKYVLKLSPSGDFVLGEYGFYEALSGEGLMYRSHANEACRYLLKKLGYSEARANRILADCYRYESRLAAGYTSNISLSGPAEEQVIKLSAEELEKLMGAYPIMDQLAAWDVEPQEAYYLVDEEYFANLSRCYDERYLEEIKAVCIVRTVLAVSKLLDDETKAHILAIEDSLQLDFSDNTLQGTPLWDDVQEPGVWEAWNYLAQPLDQLYAAAYCTPEMKEQVSALAEDTVDYLREMLSGIEWLSEEARTAAVGKLDAMDINSLYPDKFNDFSGLSFAAYDEGGTLPLALSKISAYDRKLLFSKLGQPVEDWNQEMVSLTTFNCGYAIAENDVYICAGFATGEVYSPDMSTETLYARLGAVIGHEITHAFDSEGYKRDANGELKKWWTNEDVEQFEKRAEKMRRYYSAMTIDPGILVYDGNQVAPEAIADMGGVKAMLGLAREIEGFDYEEFFIAYARMWSSKDTYSKVLDIAKFDAHPLSFLRTNVTLQQFDEFIETFDIQPGDGMYLAPEDRISVW